MNQYFWDTGNPEIKRVSKMLRKAGYRIIVGSMGNQVTPVGVIKMTMVTIMNPDDNVPNIEDIHTIFRGMK